MHVLLCQSKRVLLFTAMMYYFHHSDNYDVYGVGSDPLQCYGLCL